MEGRWVEEKMDGKEIKIKRKGLDSSNHQTHTKKNKAYLYRSELKCMHHRALLLFFSFFVFRVYVYPLCNVCLCVLLCVCCFPPLSLCNFRNFAISGLCYFLSALALFCKLSQGQNAVKPQITGVWIV